MAGNLARGEHEWTAGQRLASAYLIIAQRKNGPWKCKIKAAPCFPGAFSAPFQTPVPLLFVRSFATRAPSVSKDKRDLPEEYEKERQKGERRTGDGERGKDGPVKEGG